MNEMCYCIDKVGQRMKGIQITGDVNNQKSMHPISIPPGFKTFCKQDKYLNLLNSKDSS